MVHEKKITKVKSDAKTKPVKVKSSALMKQYIDAAWLRLAGISVSEVATRLSRGNGVPSNSDKPISDAIHTLVNKIDHFRPMVLWSCKDASPYRNRNVAWQGRLMKIAELVTKDSRPAYLIDAVNKILKAESRRRIDELKSSIQSDAQKAKTDLTEEELSRLSSVRLRVKEIKKCYECTPLILSKYLHLQYQEGMKMEDLARKMEPSVIAKFIIEHDGVQWEYLPVKMDAKTYGVRIDEKSSWTSADVRKHLEIPYVCPSVITIKNDRNVLADVQNDIKVIDEYIDWYTSSGKIDFSEEYRQKYDSYRQRLKTFDLSVDTFKQKHGDDVQVQSKSAEEDPGEEPDFLTPDDIVQGQQITKTDVPGSGSEQTTTNYQKLMAFLNEKVTKDRVPYLARNITENNNASYIRQFSNRSDFDEVFEILVKNSNRQDFMPKVTANEIMGYVRNVVLRNERTWPKHGVQ